MVLISGLLMHVFHYALVPLLISTVFTLNKLLIHKSCEDEVVVVVVVVCCRSTDLLLRGSEYS